MKRARTECSDKIHMLLGGVAFMGGKVIFGVGGIHFKAVAVTRDLGKDRCRGNSPGKCVAFDDWLCRHFKIAGDVTVHKHEIGLGGELCHRATHGKLRGV